MKIICTFVAVKQSSNINYQKNQTMAKTIIIGVVTEFDQVITKDTYSSQQFRVLVTEFNQETGEKRPDQVFPITIFNKKIKELQIERFKNKRVKAEAFLKSQMSEKDGKVFFNLLLNAHKVEEL
jgi:hypothetical protein